MAAVIGFLIGYVLGARAGQAGLEQLQSAWATVSTSAEVRQMGQGALAVGRDLAGAARSWLAERLQPQAQTSSRLRPVA